MPVSGGFLLLYIVGMAKRVKDISSEVIDFY